MFGEQMVIPSYGVWEHFGDIDFDAGILESTLAEFIRIVRYLLMENERQEKMINEMYHIIFEFELCDYNLNQYFLEEGKLETDKDFFKIVVQDIAKALMTLQKYGIIHRDIKPSSMFLIEIDGKRVVKLGDFGCAINKKDNQSDSIGTYLYNAPEVIKNLEYDDKCDLWSLGVSLFELYLFFVVLLHLCIVMILEVLKLQ